MVELVLRGPQSPDDTGGGDGSASSLGGSLFSADMLRVLSDARHGRGGRG